MHRNRIRWVPAVAALLLMGLLLAGCSGESSDNASTADSAAGSSSFGSSASADKSSVQMEAKSEVAVQDQSGNASPAESAVSAGAGNAGAQPGTAATGAEAEDETGFDRKIVYKATLTMEVKDFDQASVKLQNILHQSGGYILKFSDSKNSSETGATYTLKVPADGFTPFLKRLEEIEHSDFDRRMEGTDVTEEYVDLTARLKAKQVVEARLLAFMDKAQSASDLLQFSSQLASVQGDIERIKGRMRYLDTNVAFSTIELRMYQPVAGTVVSEGSEPLGARMGHALAASTKQIGAIVQGLLVFAAGALPVLIMLLIVLSLLWFVRRSLRGRALHPLKPGTGLAGPPASSPLRDQSEDEGKPKN